MFGNNNTTNSLFSNTSFEDEAKPEKSKQESALFSTRQQMAVSIRKQERQKEIMKRRKMNSTATISESTVQMNPFEIKLREFTKKDFAITQIVELNQCIHSGDLEKSHYGIIGIRKLLSQEKQPPIQMVIDSNMVPKIIEFAKQSEYPALRAEATWALTNIAAGSPLQCQSVIDKGGIQLFVQLLKSSDEQVLEQAVWAAGNIAADRQFYRDTFLKQGVINVLSTIIEKSTNLKIVTQSCWAISNMVKLKPPPKYEQIKRSIPALVLAIKQNKIQQHKILSSILLLLSAVCENHVSRVSVLVKQGLPERLLALLKHENKDVVASSVKALGTICYSNQLHIESLLQKGILENLSILLDHPKNVVKRQVCWMLSNITASTPAHTQMVMSNRNIMQKMYQILTAEDSSANMKKQAAHFFLNIADMQTSKSLQLLQYFYEGKFIIIFINFAKDKKESDLAEVGLKGIEILLRLGEECKSQVPGGKSPMMTQFVNNQGIDVLEDAQYNPKIEVYDLSVKIVKTFFEIDDPLQI